MVFFIICMYKLKFVCGAVLRRAGAPVSPDGPASLLEKVRAVAGNPLVALMLHGRQAAQVYCCTLLSKNKAL